MYKFEQSDSKLTSNQKLTEFSIAIISSASALIGFFSKNNRQTKEVPTKEYAKIGVYG